MAKKITWTRNSEGKHEITVKYKDMQKVFTVYSINGKFCVQTETGSYEPSSVEELRQILRSTYNDLKQAYKTKKQEDENRAERIQQMEAMLTELAEEEGDEDEI